MNLGCWPRHNTVMKERLIHRIAHSLIFLIYKPNLLTSVENHLHGSKTRLGEGNFYFSACFILSNEKYANPWTNPSLRITFWITRIFIELGSRLPILCFFFFTIALGKKMASWVENPPRRIHLWVFCLTWVWALWWILNSFWGRIS